MSLPWEIGGLQRGDIPAQVSALQAKVAARLLHPCWQAWKPLMQRAFQRYLPALGPAALVRSLSAAHGVGRSPGHVEYWRDFAQLRLHRLLEPAHMTVHHHLRERLAASCRVARQGVTGGLVPPAAWLAALSPAVGGAGGLTVGGLRCALLSSDAAVRRVAEQDGAGLCAAAGVAGSDVSAAAAASGLVCVPMCLLCLLAPAGS